MKRYILNIFGSASSVAGRCITCSIMFHTGCSLQYATLSHIEQKINIIFTISMLQATLNYYNSSVDSYIY